MLSRYIFYTKSICILLGSLIIPCNHVWAKAPKLLQSTVAPASHQWIAVSKKAKSSLPMSLKQISQDTLKNPSKLVNYFVENPDQLDISTMSPEIAHTLSQLLLFANQPLLAAQLLTQAVKKWPQDINLLHVWGNVTFKLGMPSYSRALLQRAVEQYPSSSYTRYLYAVALFLENPKDMNQLARTHQQLTELLRRDPNYQGPNSINAEQIKNFMQQLENKMAGKNTSQSPQQVPAQSPH